MGLSLTDILLFGGATSEHTYSKGLRILGKRKLLWGAIAHALDVIVRGVSPLSLPDAVADGLKYVKAFGDCENRNLPEGYQELEYIEGHNNEQYINTGIVPTSSMSMYFKGQFVSVDESTPNQASFFMGARDVGAISGVFFQEASMTTSLDFFQSGTRWATSRTRAVNDIVELKVKNALAEVFINGSSIGTNQFTPDETTQYPIFLNALNNIGQPFDSNVNVVNRIYRFTIDGICDMRPARRLSDNAIGMWDKIRKQFFANAGTGTFTAGNAVTAPTPTEPQDIWCNNGAVKAIRPMEYLESTGTQYIDTGFKTNNNSRLVVDFYANLVDKPVIAQVQTDYNGMNVSLGVAETSGNAQTAMLIYNGLTANDINYARILKTDIFGEGTGRYTVDINKQTTTVTASNGSTFSKSFNLTEYSSNLTLWLFAKNHPNTPVYGKCKIYSAKIYDNGTLVRDFIPALDANNIPCMFDKVEGKCYYNAGTGQFIAPYLPAEYEELEYIQSTGTQYIDTGIVPTSSSNIDIKFQTQPSSGFSTVCGARNATFGGVNVSLSPTNFLVDWFGTANTNRWSDLTISSNKIYDFSVYNSVATVSLDDSVIDTHTFTPVSGGATTQQMYLFGMNNNGVLSTSSNTIKIYRFTVAGVCDMIPARKRSNGHIGMYDLIRRQFFENAGEGQFTFGKLPVLPETYTRLEYLESTGTQYINTGVVPNQDTSVELDGSIDGYGIFFGVRTAALVDISTIQGTSTGYWAMGYNTSADAIGSKDSNRHVWFKNKNLQYMDGVLKQNYTYANFTAMGNAYLFAYNNNGTVGYFTGRVKIYSCKIWATADSMLVRHLIPAKRNSDSVVGMYDIMNDVFLTNQGTGDFEYGAEIPDSRESYYYVDGDVETIATKAGGSTLSTATCENLLGIGSTQDIQEILTGSITRKVGIKVLTGDEVWFKAPNATSLFGTRLCEGTIATAIAGLSTHFFGTTSGNANMEDGSIKILTASTAAPGYVSCYIKANLANDNLTSWMTWLRQQYDAGTPVIVVYPLVADETETVAGQTLTVSAGNNTVEIIQASIDDLMLEAKYTKSA